MYISGVQTPNCIRATAFDGIALDYFTAVIADASAAATEEVHQYNLYDIRQAGGQTPTLEEWMAGAWPPSS